MRHFDSHAYRTEDQNGVWDFAAGSMRTYLILKEKAARFNADAEIQGLLGRAQRRAAPSPAARVKFSADGAHGAQGAVIRSRRDAQAGLRVRAPRSADDGAAARSALTWPSPVSSAWTSGRAASRRFSSARDGEVEASAVTPLQMSTPHPGWAEQDPEAWWQATLASIKTVLAAQARRARRRRSASRARCIRRSFSTRRASVIRPALLWCDGRTTAECREITDRVGGESRLRDLASQSRARGIHAAQGALAAKS